MLAKCSNSSCPSTFHSLDQGELFRIEPDPIGKSDCRKVEYFWLCETCSSELTLGFDEHAQVRTVRCSQFAEHPVDSVEFLPVDRHQGLILTRVRFLNHKKCPSRAPITAKGKAAHAN